MIHFYHACDSSNATMILRDKMRDLAKLENQIWHVGLTFEGIFYQRSPHYSFDFRPNMTKYSQI